MRIAFSFSVFFSVVWTSSISVADDSSIEIINTQAETAPLLSPEEALGQLQLPDGFHATLFAAEPEVRQPIGMTFDARGRLWVAECDTYAERPTGYDLSQRDRVVIFEDLDGDGTSDVRKIFWDQGHHLTSVEVGLGGVWVLCAPDLLFFPDRDQDDQPDGPAQVMLTGFNNDSIRHNIVNGLKWGPDGWLYGRHGITTTSFVGTPETPEELRTPLNCSIWRFHPQSHRFEVVCRGTTNSWGHDWNEHGELFFINTVIGHLWHAIPGAHFERMFGQDFNPHLYRLIPQTADHVHWDSAENWTDIRDQGQVTMSQSTDAAGGGHAHCGFMIYQGTNWPQEYRGDAFTVNLHGRRLNRDQLVRQGAGFVGRHRPDFISSGDVWFRGIELTQGPNGSVYLLDWSDLGECHDNDGIHRSSGRVYKIRYGDNADQPSVDFRSLSLDALVEHVQSADAWTHRMARQMLQERYLHGEDLTQTRSELQQLAQSSRSAKIRLQAIWSLMSTGGVDEPLRRKLAHDESENVRVWSLRILQEQAANDNPLSSQQIRELQTAIPQETSGLVLLHCASLLQRLNAADRLSIGLLLLQQGEFADDRQFPLMVWYGIEPAVAEFPLQTIELVNDCQLPEVQSFLARRITTGSKNQPQIMQELVSAAMNSDDSTGLQILTGMQHALDGLRKVQAPPNWDFATEQFSKRGNEELQALVRELSVTFGDGRAVDELRQIATNNRESFAARSNAIQSLVTAKDSASRSLLEKLLTDRDLGVDAIRGLAVIGDERSPQLIVKSYNSLRGHVRPVAMETLASRPDYALVLLQAVREKTISPEEVPPFYVRQMRSFDDSRLQSLLHETFPQWRHTSAEKEERVNQLRNLLTTSHIAEANPGNGRLIFEKTCASCHKLYGQGGILGPDLTGSQRSNLNYLLGNIVDPSAEVAEKFRMSIIALADGRVVSGVVLEESDELIKVQTPNETLTIMQSDIEARKNSALSMMPERQLDKMTDQEIADLFSYLMSTSQVALPN